MERDSRQSSDSTQTGGYATGEFATGEFETTRSDSSRTGSGTGSRHRRRRRSSRRRKKSAAPMLTLLGIGLFCVILVGVGVLVGLSYSSDQGDAERYHQALQARQAAHNEWLKECGNLGYAEWTCGRFDRVHFEKAKKLDLFRCKATDAASLHQCQYKLGTAEVLVWLPEPYEVNGKFFAPRERAYAVVEHSDVEDRYYVSVSEQGRIELRSQDALTPLFVINPSTGSLNALHEDVRPDE